MCNLRQPALQPGVLDLLSSRQKSQKTKQSRVAKCRARMGAEAEYLWLGRLAPWSWSWAPASWAPASWATWWKQLVRKERRKERSGERGREQSTCGLAPWSWSSAPASWAPWWKAGSCCWSGAPRRRQPSGALPPYPLGPYLNLSSRFFARVMYAAPFPRAGHPPARVAPRAPPARVALSRALLPRCDMASSSTLRRPNSPFTA